MADMLIIGIHVSNVTRIRIWHKVRHFFKGIFRGVKVTLRGSKKSCRFNIALRMISPYTAPSLSVSTSTSKSCSVQLSNWPSMLCIFFWMLRTCSSYLGEELRISNWLDVYPVAGNMTTEYPALVLERIPI